MVAVRRRAGAEAARPVAEEALRRDPQGAHAGAARELVPWRRAQCDGCAAGCDRAPPARPGSGPDVVGGAGRGGGLGRVARGAGS